MLERGSVQSCGCLKEEAIEVNRKKAVKSHLEKNIIEGTNISIISRKNVNSSNTSGVTGVSLDNKRKKWVAQIVFKGTHYNLGRFDKKDNAIKIRKQAEEKLFGEFLEWYYKEFKNKQGDKDD